MMGNRKRFVCRNPQIDFFLRNWKAGEKRRRKHNDYAELEALPAWWNIFDRHSWAARPGTTAGAAAGTGCNVDGRRARRFDRRAHGNSGLWRNAPGKSGDWRSL